MMLKMTMITDKINGDFKDDDGHVVDDDDNDDDDEYDDEYD